jgi:hypothetical protein
MFADLGARIISLDTIRETSDKIIEGKPHLQIGHPASGVSMPLADVEVAQKVVTSSVIPQVPPMEAGVASIDPATETSNVEKPHPDTNIDETRSVRVGDQICECGRWRAPAQNVCECGQTTSQFVGDSTDAIAWIVRSMPDEKQGFPAPQTWGDATPWPSPGEAAAVPATSSGGGGIGDHTDESIPSPRKRTPCWLRQL